MTASPPAVPRLVPSAPRLAKRTAGALGRVVEHLLAAGGPARWP